MLCQTPSGPGRLQYARLQVGPDAPGPSFDDGYWLEGTEVCTTAAVARSAMAVPTDLSSVISPSSSRPATAPEHRSNRVPRTFGAMPAAAGRARSPDSVMAVDVSRKTDASAMR